MKEIRGPHLPPASKLSYLNPSHMREHCNQNHQVTQISRGTIWRQPQNTRGPAMMCTKSQDLEYYGYPYHLFISHSRTAQVIQTAFPVASYFSLVPFLTPVAKEFPGT